MQHGHAVIRRIAIMALLALTFGVRAASAGSISVQWDPNTETDVVGYRVFIGTQPGVYSSSVDVGNTTSYVFNNALDGQQYCFAVAAYIAGPRLGDRSAEVCRDTTGNQPPTLANPGNQSHAIGAALTLTLNGSDPEGSPVTYSAMGLPTGLTLNTNTGFISGTPTVVGTYSPKVTVSDGSLSTTQMFAWTITSAVPGAATLLRPSGSISTTTPTFEWESVATATSYRLWVDDASATDPRVQLDVTPTQAGCSTTGAVCHVSPGVALAVGRASWSVRASNASGAGPWSGAMDFSIADTRIPVVAITTPTSSSSFSTAATTIALAGTATDDGGVTQVTWTNNLGGSGTATGTATWSVASVPIKTGTNLITVTARDAGGNIATDVLSVTKADSGAPQLTILSPAASGLFVSIYSTTSATLAMTGSASDDAAVTQVSWANDRGGSGAASGTTAWSIPSIALKAGTNVIAVTAHDAAGNTTTKTFTAMLTDGETPTVTITSPVSAGTFSTANATIALGGTASDNVGVTSVKWSNSLGGDGVATGTTAWAVPGVTLKAGVNVITVVARDAAGNVATDVLAVTLGDSVAPVLAITTPTSAASYSTSATSVSLAGTASDNASVTEVRWVSDRGGSGAAVGTTAWSATVPLQSGVNVITVAARDAAGNVASDRIAITASTVDSQAPAVSILAPAGGVALTNKATLALAGKASDNVGVTQVTWQNSRGGSGAAAGTADWSVSGVALLAGSNVITVKARDAAGNVAAATLNVTFDITAPAVRIVTPSADSSFSATASQITLAGVAADDFNLARIIWASDRGGSGVASGTSSWTVAGLPLQPGVNVITVTAVDTAGNVATDVVRITTELGAPKIALTSPTTADSYATSSSNVALTGVASDDTGIVRVKWSTDKGQTGTAVGTTSWSVPLITVPFGTTVVTVTAYDTAGNSSNVALKIVYADTSKPVVKIYTPTTASSFTTKTSSVTVAGTATDNVGVTKVTWATDRGASGTVYGTGSWSTPSIAVPSGTTVITITARDAAGNTGEAVLTVTSTTTPTTLVLGGMSF